MDQEEISCACEVLANMATANPNLLAQRDEDGWSALHIACYCGCVGQCLSLLSLDADVNAAEHTSGHTPLHLASLGLSSLFQSHENSVQVPYLANTKALIKNYVHIISTLLKYGAGVFNNNKGATPCSFVKAVINNRKNANAQKQLELVKQKLEQQTQSQRSRCALKTCLLAQSPCTLTDLKNCSKCSTVRYCSRVCQQEDWKQHRVVCNTHVPGIGLPKPTVNPVNGRPRYF